MVQLFMQAILCHQNLTSIHQEQLLRFNQQQLDSERRMLNVLTTIATQQRELLAELKLSRIQISSPSSSVTPLHPVPVTTPAGSGRAVSHQKQSYGHRKQQVFPSAASLHPNLLSMDSVDPLQVASSKDTSVAVELNRRKNFGVGRRRRHLKSRIGMSLRGSERTVGISQLNHSCGIHDYFVESVGPPLTKN